jgi:CspA family cold shock protein
MKGQVRFFSPLKGFGFIYSGELRRDVFVHASGILPKENGERILHAKDLVEFETEPAIKGIKATKVKVITKGVEDNGNKAAN